MRNRILTKTVAVLSIASLTGLAAGCYGSFQLTRNLYQINQSVEEKYVRSALTWVLVIPYAVTGFLDFAIFNVIEFWSGESRVEPLKQSRVYREGADAFVVTLARGGGDTEMTIERFRSGRPVSTQTVRDDGREVTSTLVPVRGEAVRTVVLRHPDGSVDLLTTSSSGETSRRLSAADVLRETSEVARSLRDGRGLFAEGGGIPPVESVPRFPVHRG